jgi:hypothetical protein
VGEDGAFMSGSYVLMDGGLRDSRGSWEPEPTAMEELGKHMQAAEARRARLQPLIDER